MPLMPIWPWQLLLKGVSQGEPYVLSDLDGIECVFLIKLLRSFFCKFLGKCFAYLIDSDLGRPIR